MAEEILQNVITADASQATPAFEQILAAAQKLNEQLAQTGEAGKASVIIIEEGAKKASASLTEVGAKGAAAGKEVAAGAAGGAAAIEGMRDASLELRDALLSLAGPITALFAIGEAFKSAVEASSKAQSSLAEIRILLENQGSSAEGAAEKMEQYATAIAKVSQFAKGDYLDGMRQMLAAGVSANDAMRSQSAAMELATATGRSLVDVEEALASAYNGRMRGLASLGIVTKEEMKTGLDYETVLQRIEDRTKGGVAAANETLTGQLALMRNNVEALMEKIGDGLSPALSTLASDVSAAAIAVIAFSDGSSPLKDTLVSIGDGLGNVISGLVSVAESGPGAVAIVGALTVATGKFAVSLAVDAVEAISAFVAAQATAIVSTARFAVSLGVDAVAAIGAFVVAQSAAAAALTRELVVALAIGGPEAIGTMVAAMGAGALAITAALAEFIVPIALVGAAIAGLAWAFSTHLDAMKEKADAIITWIVNRFGDLVEAVSNAIRMLGNVASNFGLSGVAGALNGAASATENFGYAAKTAKIHVDDLVAGAQKLVSGSIGFLTGGFHPGAAPKPPTSASTHHIAGTPSAGSNAAPFEAQTLTDQAHETDAVVASQEKLKAQLQAISDGELAYKNAVSLATTEQQKERAELALRQKGVDDAAQSSALLTKQIGAERAELTLVTAQHFAAVTALKNSTTAYNTYSQSLDGVEKPTKLQLQHLADLKKAHEDAKTAVDRTDTTMRQLTVQIDENTKALDQQKAKLMEVAAAHAAMQVELDKEKTKLIDELATYKLSIEQQIAYYQQRLALLAASGDEETQMFADYQKKILELQADGQKQRIDAYVTFQTTWQNQEKSFLDGIITGHKSLRDSLKSIFDDIVGDFAKMIEEMIVKSALLKPLQAAMASIFGGSSAAQSSVVSAASAGAQSYGLLGAFAGTSGAQSILSNIPASTGTNSSGVFADVLSGSYGGGYGSAAPRSGGIAASGALTTLGGAALAVQGLQQGGVVGGAETGLGVDAALTGLGVAGAIATPVAVAAGLYSLFSHHDDPHRQPDKYNTAEYGQMVANLGGDNNGLPFHANGSSFTEDSATSSALNGLSMIGYIQSFVLAHKNDAAGSATQTLAAKLLPIWGDSTTGGTGALGVGKDGSFVLPGGSESGYYSDIFSDAQSAISEIQATGASVTSGGASGGSSSISRTYPNFNIANVSDSSGSSIVSGSGGSSVSPGSTGALGSTGIPPGFSTVTPIISRRGADGSVTHVLADFSGATIVGPGGLDSAAVEISQALRRVSAGETAGSPARSTNISRWRGDF